MQPSKEFAGHRALGEAPFAEASAEAFAEPLPEASAKSSADVFAELFEEPFVESSADTSTQPVAEQTLLSPAGASGTEVALEQEEIENNSDEEQSGAALALAGLLGDASKLPVSTHELSELKGRVESIHLTILQLLSRPENLTIFFEKGGKNASEIDALLQTEEGTKEAMRWLIGVADRHSIPHHEI